MLCAVCDCMGVGKDSEWRLEAGAQEVEEGACGQGGADRNE